MHAEATHTDPGHATRAFLAARAFSGHELVLGLSGGVDSSVLLHILAGLRAELGFSVRAIHVHHGLSPNADAWSEHCHVLCAKYAVPLAVERVRVVPAGQGTEAAARIARYAAFARHPGDALILAHHLDDQVETYFLRLLRGAGARGLAGMAEDRQGNGLRILRPLLGVTRADIDAYARRERVIGINDESNLDTRLTRNFLRQAWLPGIAERFPAYRQNVARAMAHARDLEDMARAIAEDDMGRLTDPEHPEVTALIALGATRGVNLLRHWLAQRVETPPDSRQIAELWRQVTGARQDADLIWRLGDAEVRRYRGRVYYRVRRAPVEMGTIAWRGESLLAWPVGGALEIRAVHGAGIADRFVSGRVCVFSAWQGGMHLRFYANRPGKPVKKWFQELGVPPWQRAETPMLRIDGRLAWVAGLGVDVAFQARPDEPGWLISWQPRP